MINPDAARIVIVEDDHLVAEDLRWRVAALGYDVVGMADSGEEAVALANALRPDLVLVDVRLTGLMTGLEAGTLIEQSLAAAIVYVTATPVPDRMPFFVPKPFVPATLAAVIAKALAGKN